MFVVECACRWYLHLEAELDFGLRFVRHTLTRTRTHAHTHTHPTVHTLINRFLAQQTQTRTRTNTKNPCLHTKGTRALIIQLHLRLCLIDRFIFVCACCVYVYVYVRYVCVVCVSVCVCICVFAHVSFFVYV